jgi:hypothetical protein
MSAMVSVLQEQLLTRERELNSQENGLMSLEDDLVAIECALGRVCMECDAECDQDEAVQRDYPAKMRASTTSCQHSLDFDRVLRGCQFILNMQEMNLEWQEVMLAEEQARGLHSFDGRDLSVVLEDPHKRVAGVENECTTKAVQLSWSVKEISDALVDLGVFPFRTSLRIWGQPRMS